MTSRGFTLIELLIVVLLIGIIYSFAIFTFQKREYTPKLTTQDIASLLKEHLKSEKIELICYDNCIPCVIQKNNKKIAELRNSFFSENLESLALNTSGDLKKKIYPDRFINNSFKKVCFEYAVYPNGSGSELIIQDNQKYYIYRTIDQEVELFNDENEVKKFLINKNVFPTSVDSYHISD